MITALKSLTFVVLSAYLSLVPGSTAHAETHKVKIGKFESRALWTSPESSNSKPLRPALILVPAAGAFGPEEAVPPAVTLDGQAHFLFNELSEPFSKAGFYTLALGKPGVEFFSAEDPAHFFYDQSVFANLSWQDQIDNLAAAVTFVRQQPGVDPKKIFVLGQSEGTMVAVDYAQTDSKIAGLILLGYVGEDLSTIYDWQTFRRYIDQFVATDVDSNHDGFVTRSEAASFPDFTWNWANGVEKITYAEIEAALRQSPELKSAYQGYKESKIWKDVFSRGPNYLRTAQLSEAVYVFDGSIDMLTPPDEALKLGETCKELKKQNCWVKLVPGLGHGFSKPRGPRLHPLMDGTLGPIDPEFLQILSKLAEGL